jgi:outer membrane protein assembly factor BamA
VSEGTQYHLGQIHFDVLSDRASQELIKVWKLKPGDVFDAAYLNDYLQKAALKKLFEMGIRPARTSAKNQVDKEKAIVDQYVEFR